MEGGGKEEYIESLDKQHSKTQTVKINSLLVIINHHIHAYKNTNERNMERKRKIQSVNN